MLGQDGTRVEAKTPEGTRIATPSQINAGISATDQSGAATPRTGSYAGAVKTAPVDWHIEFSYNGHILSLADTIYGAVHKHQVASEAGGVGTFGGVYGMPVVFKFKKVDGPALSNSMFRRIVVNMSS
jgi:E3 ubiquitin-protein ligase TRIP12